MTKMWSWLKLVLAIGILVALGMRLGTDAFVSGLRSITGWSVLAALGIGLFTTVLCAARWCVVAGGLGLPLSLRAAVADYYRSLLLNAVLPAGVLGDVHRAVDHGRRSGNVGRGVRAVVFERAAGAMVLVLIALGVLAALPVPGVDLAPDRVTVLGVIAVLALAPLGLARVPAVRRWAAEARAALFTRYAAPRVLALSAATIAGHVALLLVAARVAGSHASPAHLIPLAVVALLVMGIPVNIGGFGPREAFLAVAFAATGLGAATGVATGVVFGVLAMISALPGALTLLPGRSAFVKRPVAGEHVGQPVQHELTLTA
ncbi:UPF0104 family protein [Pseudonocardiaceae bacterium YIM PH 21723]|nr:UPF0104 family protein [Pseudonocardiaceae bacterium YIM PH 21723]